MTISERIKIKIIEVGGTPSENNTIVGYLRELAAATGAEPGKSDDIAGNILALKFGGGGFAIDNFEATDEISQSAFYGVEELISVKYDRVQYIRDGAFQNCVNLETADFPKVKSIGGQAFRNCTALKSINFPVATSIGMSYAFSACDNLTKIVFPVLTSVPDSAFAYCKGLEVVDLPAVTSIDSYAFDGTKNIKALILRKSQMVNLGRATEFSNSAFTTGEGYIYVPSALVDTYKANSNWSTYADRFRAIEDYPDICG